MKVIQTKYKGYYFRSRLEARWAVFFDSINIKWEYEKEGFHFNDGTNYLPDFWLPEVNMWAEVKGEEFTDEETKKAINLANGTGNPVLKLIGIPEPKTYAAIHNEDGEGYYGYALSNYHNYPQTESRFYSDPPGMNIEDMGFEDTIKAIIKSKEFRFEYGKNNE